MARVSLETAKRIRDVWPHSSSLADAMRRAGLSGKDAKTHNMNRRAAEKLLGITLPSLNVQYKTATDDTQCPSFLDYSKALKHKLFVITSATNNSKLNEKFFDTLETLCVAKSAQLLVCPIRYWHNQFMGKKDYHWPGRIYPYVINQRDLILNKSIQVSSLTANATAVDPLSGVKPLGGTRSAIYGATSLHMRCLPTHGREHVKMIHTTGSCTAKTYTRSVAGTKARFHHTFSAVLVLLVGDHYLHTQLIWDGKGITLLDEYWTPDGPSEAPRCEGVVRGDEHSEWQEQHVLAARARACARLNPKKHVFEDVFDAISVSHHAKLLDKVQIFKSGLHCLRTGLETAAALIDKTGGDVNVIVDSNHDRHLERYINEGRHLKDPHNFEIASELSVKASKSGKSMLQCYLEDNCKSKLVFPDINKPYFIKGIDCGQHGDIGPNGSRGGMKAFANAVHKMIVGHSHTAWIYQGAWGAGVSTKLIPYAKGLSSWTYADVFIGAKGKRFTLFYINGKSLVDYL